MTRAFKSPPASATFFTIIGVIILCTLCTWQVKRLAWKTDLLKQIHHEHLRDDVSTTPLYADTPDMKRGFVTGLYLHDKTIYMMPRTHEGATGYHVITPLLINNDRSILINRGWIPLDNQKDLSNPTGLVKVHGVLKTIRQANMFTPKNVPEKNQWYHENIAEISNALALENPWQKILYAEQSTETNAKLPIPSAVLPNLKNNHAGYALFWLAMACALIGVFLLRFVWVKEDSP